jgi:VWFA-related protein
MASIRSKLVALGFAILPLVAVDAAVLHERQADEKIVVQSREEPQVALSADLVEVLVTVVDSKGRPVRGLPRSSFEVLDNGAPQQISHFSDQGEPLSLAVVLDATGMGSDTVEGLLGALRRSRLVAEHAAEISFLALNERASVAMGFVGTGDQVLRELRFADPDGPLSVREALACVQGGLRAPPKRTLVLLITDGDTNVGPRGIDNGVESGRAQLYVVFATAPDSYRGQSAAARARGYPSWQWWRPYSLEAAERNLNRGAASRIASRSGGRALYAFAESEQARVELFDRIGDEVSSQYAIGYYPTANNPGWHRVVVRLAPKALAKGLSVSHRPGYRTPR